MNVNDLTFCYNSPCKNVILARPYIYLPSATVCLIDGTALAVDLTSFPSCLPTLAPSHPFNSLRDTPRNNTTFPTAHATYPSLLFGIYAVFYRHFPTERLLPSSPFVKQVGDG